MAVKLVVKGSKFCVQTQGFSTDWRPDRPSNRYTLVVWLRWLRNEQGQPLLTLQQLAPLVGSANRQAASQHVETFRAGGEDFREFVLRQRKVDEKVVAAVTEALRQRPLAGPTELAQPVNERLGRQDLSEAHRRAALTPGSLTSRAVEFKRNSRVTLLDRSEFTAAASAALGSYAIIFDRPDYPLQNGFFPFDSSRLVFTGVKVDTTGALLIDTENKNVN